MGLKETASAINGGNSTIKIVIEETPFISHGPSSCSSGVFDHFLIFINQCNAIDWECKKNFFVSSCVDGDCYFWILRKLLGSLKCN
ncbi:hypothetical protein Csa_000104 [Cucumis sativus]|uniref:Uncharacterized protein n=1 Tax=Cucumis sativus TaxID=3659 RepID=A0A0A0KLZ8_CUCSA|nr:hypothetical protein Csa_000104 [Cucumis sativus]